MTVTAPLTDLTQICPEDILLGPLDYLKDESALAGIEMDSRLPKHLCHGSYRQERKKLPRNEPADHHETPCGGHLTSRLAMPKAEEAGGAGPSRCFHSTDSISLSCQDLSKNPGSGL